MGKEGGLLLYLRIAETALGAPFSCPLALMEGHLTYIHCNLLSSVHLLVRGSSLDHVKLACGPQWIFLWPSQYNGVSSHLELGNISLLSGTEWPALTMGQYWKFSLWSRFPPEREQSRDAKCQEEMSWGKHCIIALVLYFYTILFLNKPTFL